MNTFQIISLLFAIGVLFVYFFKRPKSRKYLDDHISIVQDFNESDIEIQGYVFEYQNLATKTLIELSKTELPEKRRTAIRQVLAERDMTPFGNIHNP